VPHLQRLKFYLRKHHSSNQQHDHHSPLPLPTSTQSSSQEHLLHQNHHHHQQQPQNDAQPTVSPVSHSHKEEAVQTDDLPQLSYLPTGDLTPIQVSHTLSHLPKQEAPSDSFSQLKTEPFIRTNGIVLLEDHGKEAKESKEGNVELISKCSPSPGDSDKVITHDDCCTFVTRIRLKQVLDTADEGAELPVEVNLPKDILRNVISEMVRYEQDELMNHKTNGQV